MKKYAIIILLQLFVIHAFSQSKYFIGADLKFTDSVNAKSYMLVYEKNDQDSVYRIKQFSMNNNILVLGSFKDQELSIQHGVFEYYYDKEYNASISQLKLKTYKNGKEINEPNIHYLEEKGLYIDGKKTGIWLNYFDTGEISTEAAFSNDLLNGRFRRFQKDGKIYIDGSYVNNLKDGEWSVMSGSVIDSYKLGKLLKSKKTKDNEFEKTRKEQEKYNVNPRPNGNFDENLRRFMGTFSYDDLNRQNVKVVILIDEEGKIELKDIDGLTNPDVQQKFKEFFANSRWSPATVGKEKRPVKSQFTYALHFGNQ